MTEKEIYTKLENIIRDYLPEDVSAENIQPDSDLTKELNINSSHLVDIVLDVEDTFQIALTNDDMEQLHTVKDAVRIIKNKI
ncbi:MAG: phosphopantetheine-binding protein [Flavobacteriaceae bacterium]|nr:phosphopantetheine-binding protein [Flavobacteriaceae bacterium]